MDPNSGIFEGFGVQKDTDSASRAGTTVDLVDLLNFQNLPI